MHCIFRKLVNIANIVINEPAYVQKLTLESARLNNSDVQLIRNVRSGVYVDGVDRIVINGDRTINVNNKVCIDVGRTCVSFVKY